jgi:hypothetical protein
MENTSHNYVRIENAKFGNRGIVYTAVLFILSFIICIVIGATGPEVIQIRNDGLSELTTATTTAVWNGVLEDMTPLNQMFWLTGTIIRRQNEGKETLSDLTTWFELSLPLDLCLCFSLDLCLCLSLFLSLSPLLG